MTIRHCDYHIGTWDDDEHEECPTCEANEREEEAYWRQLWNGERQAGLVGDRKDDPVPPADPRTPEYWGL
jgi:hypothetical protein